MKHIKLLIIFFFYPLCVYAIDTQEVLQKVATVIPKNPVIIEAGARFGNDTGQMAKKWPQGTIHAFEPLPNSYKELSNKVTNYQNIHTYPLALSTYSGTADFYVALENVGASSLLPPTELLAKEHNIFIKEQPIQVDCVTLDDWAQQHKVDHIDFMWLDMEGHELSMLQASPNMFKTVKAVYVEVNFKEFRVGTPLFEEVKTWFRKKGFYIMCGTIVLGAQGDILFVRK